jgi:signal transduction histidine kinase
MTTLVATLAVSLFDLYPSKTLGKAAQYKETLELIAAVRADANGQPVIRDLPDISRMWYVAFPAEMQYRLLDATGQVLLPRPPATLASSPEVHFPGGNANFDPERTRFAVMRDGAEFHVDTVPFQFDGRPLYMQTATSERLNGIYVHSRLRPVGGVIRYSLLIAVFILAVGLRYTFRRLLRPLRAISDVAAGISPGNLNTRLSLAGIPSELHALVGAFNDVLDRLEAGFKIQQSFLATTAHELQTPLTLVRGQIETQGDFDGKTQLLQDVDQMSRQVRQLLHLAEVSEPQSYQFAMTEFHFIVEDVLHFLSRQAVAKHVQIVVRRSAEPVRRHADESAVFVLLKNLVENAIAVSPAYSVVTVDIGAESIMVSDEGPGIHPDHLPHLFTRFWRAPESSWRGAGLGLSICQEIAAAHGWRLSVDPSVLCTRFVVSFSAFSLEGA